MSPPRRDSRMGTGTPLPSDSDDLTDWSSKETQTTITLMAAAQLLGNNPRKKRQTAKITPNVRATTRQERDSPKAAAVVKIGLGVMLLGTAIIIAGCLIKILQRPTTFKYPQHDLTLPTTNPQHDLTLPTTNPQHDLTVQNISLTSETKHNLTLQNVSPTHETTFLKGDMQRARCALAVGVMAANHGKLALAEEVNLTYYKPPGQEVITTTSSDNITFYGFPLSTKCKEEGVARVTVKCIKTQCIDVNAKRIMNTQKAKGMIRLSSINHRVRRSQGSFITLKTLQLKSNMLFDWLRYSAKQVSQETCVACYNAKRLPQIRPIPGSEIGSCTDLHRCFAYCTMHMANSSYRRWSMDDSVCLRKLDLTQKGDEYMTPPVVKIPQTIVFPFCIVRGGGSRGGGQAQNISLA